MYDEKRKEPIKQEELDKVSGGVETGPGGPGNTPPHMVPPKGHHGPGNTPPPKIITPLD